MQELIELIKAGKDVFTGGDLVALYAVYSLVRRVLRPLYKNGERIQKLVDALTKALNEGVFSHSEIVAELRALNTLVECSQARPSCLDLSKKQEG